MENYRINTSDLHEKISGIHRQKSMAKNKAGAINIEKIVNNMIDERLFIQEARKVKLNEDLFFKEKVKNYIIKHSVIKLRREEVTDKISSKEQEADRANKYVAELKSKAKVWIDAKLIDSPLDLLSKDHDANIIIAKVDKKPILLKDFLNEANRRKTKINEKILDSLITYELVEQEALKRNYIKEPSFNQKVNNYEENLLLNLFKQKIIFPRAIPTERELKEYYEINKDDFKKDDKFWFSEMTFSNLREATDVLKELEQGADFEFMVRKLSIATRTGANVWVPSKRFSLNMKNALNELKIGKISKVIQDKRTYKIIKLKGKRQGKHEDFFRVKDKIKRIVGKINFDKWTKKYLKQLRDAAHIHINKKLLDELMEKYTNDSNI